MLMMTLDDLYQHSGKAELLHGQVVALMPTGRAPSFAALEIAVALRLHVRGTGLPGIAVADNAGFVVDLPHRRSFSPDAAYYEGPNSGMMNLSAQPKQSQSSPSVYPEPRLESALSPMLQVQTTQ